jgi:hypothetical protein
LLASSPLVEDVEEDVSEEDGTSPELPTSQQVGSLEECLWEGESPQQFYFRVMTEEARAIYQAKMERAVEAGTGERFFAPNYRDAKCVGPLERFANPVKVAPSLCEAEHLAISHRVLQMLKRISYHYVRPQSTQTSRLTLLNTEMLAFDAAHAQGHDYTTVDARCYYWPPDYLSHWLNQQMRKIARVLLLECGPRDVCARLATLLHNLPGSRTAFPTGILTPPAGKQAWVAPLAVLNWMRELCISKSAAARDVLKHAEDVLGAQYDALRGLNRHGLHAALSWAVLSSGFFQDLQLWSTLMLDVHQRDAATYKDDTPLLIAAGPGAGKTRTIGARALYIQAVRVGAQAMQTAMQAEDIVAVTFTRRAKEDLVKKFRDESGGPMPTVATMDGFMLSLISEVRRLANKFHSAKLPPVTNFLILADEDVQSITQKVPVSLLGGVAMPTLQGMLVKILSNSEAPKHDAKVLNGAAVEVLRALVVEYRLERRMLRDPPSPELSARIGLRFESSMEQKDREGVSKVQLPGLFASDEAPAQSLHNHLTKLCAQILEGDLSSHGFDKAAFPDGLYSFDVDKEPLALALFSSQIEDAKLACDPPPWTRQSQVQKAVIMWREAHSQTHYIVDEFQDTSPAQLAVFALLCDQTRLTVVGDSDQAIYAFRGANYAQLESAFNALQPAGATRTLHFNYRSTTHIVAVSSAVVGPNYAQSGGQKDLKAHRAVGEDYRAFAIKGRHHTAHHKMMLAQILKWKGAGLPLHHIACLFHTTNQQKKFAEHLAKNKFLDFRAMAISPAGDTTVESKERAHDGKLVLSTVHGAKGLEWEVVFVYAFDSAQWVAKNVANADPVELRRMLYVACSRPRSLLYVLYEQDTELISPVLAMSSEHILQVDLRAKELNDLVPSVERLTAGRLEPVYDEE